MPWLTDHIFFLSLLWDWRMKTKGVKTNSRTWSCWSFWRHENWMYLSSDWVWNSVPSLHRYLNTPEKLERQLNNNYLYHPSLLYILYKITDTPGKVEYSGLKHRARAIYQNKIKVWWALESSLFLHVKWWNSFILTPFLDQHS